MKTALLFFSDVTTELLTENVIGIQKLFCDLNLSVDTLEIVSPTDDIGFLHKFSRLRDTHDNLVMFVGEDLKFNLDNVIAEKTDTVFMENERAQQFLDIVRKNTGVNYSDEYASIPVTATVIPNLDGARQGYILDQNDFLLAVLPLNFNQAKKMCANYLLPYLENVTGEKVKRLTLKYFGDQNLLNKVLKRANEIAQNKLKITTKTEYGDTLINVIFDAFISEQLRGEITRFIVGTLKDKIYAEFDESLSQRLFDLLKLKNVKISVAESFTAGRVVSEIIKNSGASAYLDEGIVCYSNHSKVDRLNVKEGDIIRQGAVSSVVAYQMASGLLSKNRCDLALSTTGIAGPKSDDSDKPVGLCYIGVGSKNGIHTYKYNLTGNREEITNTAVNVALFQAIKALKNI